MEVKFKRSLRSFKILIMFDLASKISGVCVYDLQKNKPIDTYVIHVNSTTELPVAELEDKIGLLLDGTILSKYGIPKNEILVCKEAHPTQLRGGQSTISTFVALARSHAILDNYLYKHEWPTYDYTGVYPISWHAYFKKVINADKDFKVDKKVVRDYNIKEFGLSSDLSADESDAIFLAKTFVEVKWNNDLQEKVRELKRHKKTLKAPHAIKAVDEEISRILEMKQGN